MFFHVRLGHFVFVLLVLVSPVLSQEIGWEEQEQNFCTAVRL